MSNDIVNNFQSAYNLDINCHFLDLNLVNNNNNTYLYSILFTLCSNALLKKHSYTLTKYT